MNTATDIVTANKPLILAAILALVLGIGGGYWLAPSSTTTTAKDQAGTKKILFYRSPMNPAVTSPTPAKDAMGMDYVPVYAEEPKKERKLLFYRSPMNPSVTSPVPAKDAMGMDYVPVYADNDTGGDEVSGTVKIDAVTVQNIGVRTARAKQQILSRAIRTVGRVDYDEQRLTRLHPKTMGWIETLRVDKTGQPVNRGDVLLSIYSPQLVSSQQEYLLALRNQATLRGSAMEDIRKGAEDLVQTSRERLELLDVPSHQIRELEQTGKIKKSLHIHSPVDGIVMRVGARRGEYVTMKTELYMLADLSRVWVYVDIYEQELPWVKVGDVAEMQLVGIPGRVFRGKISYVYPYAESKTRTIKVRLEFDNPGLLLKPDMFADVDIQASRQIDALVVPTEAVVRSGTREQIFVVRAPGKFEPREVKLGITSNGMTQILEGVKAGEEVVTSAQFLIDSESKLREATAKMLEAAKTGDDGASKATPDVGTKGADMKDMDMGKTPAGAKGADMKGMDMGKTPAGAKGADMKGMDMGKTPAGAKGADMKGMDMGKTPVDTKGAEKKDHSAHKEMKHD
ncbi:MAG: efflux RND transporter periplasmic adaptor subunit [Gammaproteobacteria bacterium]|nr:efflux RND transporter periplasmic adaptor subunit [Gammaproteobacteria bacterium]